MNKERRAAIRRRLGPVGTSLAAAAVTAVGFAAVSLADNGGGKPKEDTGTMGAPPPPGSGAGVMHFRGRLSEGDRQKLEEFRQCMEENGAPAPPGPGRLDPSEGPPDPPSAAEREKIEKAYGACREKLPEEMQNAPGPPPPGGPGCGPPPGAHREQGQDQNRRGSKS